MVGPIFGQAFGANVFGLQTIFVTPNRCVTKMHVCVCKLRLQLPGTSSLKGKRQIVQSLISRIRNKFNVSIAEVEELDSWQNTVLAVSCVSNSKRHGEEVIAKVISYIEGTRGDVLITDIDRETLSVF